MYITMTSISERHRARFYKYKKMLNILNTKSHILGKKKGNFHYFSIYKKPVTLYYAIFKKYLRL